jgi:hypothetical protein
MSNLQKWRYVEDLGDGLCVYQCLCCHRRFCADRLLDWLYCPRCGVRWEGQHVCRPNAVPRWAWDRYGPHPPWELVCGRASPVATTEWVFLVRTKWFDEPWSDWSLDVDSPTIDVTDGSWQSVRGYLDMCRQRYAPNEVATRYERRAQIRRKAKRT